MPCIKTGAHIFVEQHNEYCWCDAFALDSLCNWDDIKLAYNEVAIEPVYLFRIVQRSFAPMADRIHFTVHNFDQWFDKGGSNPSTHTGVSTMFSADVTNHGYTGKEI